MPTTMKGLDQPLVLSNINYFSDSKCGYCHGKKEDFFALESMNDSPTRKDSKPESIIIGSSVEQMSCKQYDELINQGFRRSGTFLYKPDLLNGCCRPYTIRTNIDYLEVNKPLRKVINRFIRGISDESQKSSEKPKHKNQEKFDINSLIEAEKNSSRFHTRFEKSKFTEEKFQLYKKYQTTVHNDDPSSISVDSFKRFLCENPFLDEEVEGTKSQWDRLDGWKDRKDQIANINDQRTGPTHECYYLDNKLIAISILDFLPSGISSIYFIWDPDYAHLSLGTLSGIREIIMCKELGYQYYYLGYYIDDCEKMRYKQRFGGELLDLANEVFVPFKTCSKYIKNGRFFVLGNPEGSDGVPDFELELENTGHPASFSNSQFAGKPVTNVAESIYGNSKVYEIASKSQKVLEQVYGIDFPKTLTSIPLVMPGIIPLWQIVEWFEAGILNSQFPVSLFRLLRSQMVECTFGELTSKEKSIIVNFIRVFGIEKTQDSIILIY